jgi:hypothetical protein
MGSHAMHSWALKPVVGIWCQKASGHHLSIIICFKVILSSFIVKGVMCRYFFLLFVDSLYHVSTHVICHVSEIGFKIAKRG